MYIERRVVMYMYSRQEAMNPKYSRHQTGRSRRDLKLIGCTLALGNQKWIWRGKSGRSWRFVEISGDKWRIVEKSGAN